VKPAARRTQAQYAVERYGISERRSCSLFGIGRSTKRYRSCRQPDDLLRSRLRELASELPRYGYKRLCRRLRKQGWPVNHKRIHRIYREEGLMVRKRKRKQLIRRGDRPAPPHRSNQRWSMDFTSDQLADGRRIRTFNVVDDFTRECIAIEVNRSLTADRLVEVLDAAARTRAYPIAIVCDNGPEFVGRVLEQWAYAHNVTLRFIQPGKPVQNCFVESFNGRFRDECLNEHWFTSMADARTTIESWRNDYNKVREHNSLGGLTPTEFAKRAMETAENAAAFSAVPTAPATTMESSTFHPVPNIAGGPKLG
jgi:putative transposase